MGQEQEKKYDDIHLPTLENGAAKVKLLHYEGGGDRKTQKTTGVAAAYLNMLKATFGTGMLSMPIAFKNMGLCFGPVVLAFTAALMIYCGILVVRNIRKICAATNNSSITYPHAMRIVMEQGPVWARKISVICPVMVNTLNILCQYLTLSSYILFIANVNKQMFDYYSPFAFDLRYHILIISFPLIILNCCLRNLQVVSYFSILGNFLQMVAVSISYYYLYDSEYKGIDELNKVGPWNEILLGFGTSLYSFTSVGVLLSLEYSMNKPEWLLKPCGVLNTGVLFTLVVYISIGVMGYGKFGDEIAGTYILNLPNNLLASATVVAFGISVFSGFLVHIYPIVEIVILWYLNRKGKSFTDASKRELLLLDIGTRCLVIVVGAILVIVFSRINLLIGFIGIFCMASLNIIFPCLIEYCMACYEEPHNKGRKIRIGILGSVCFILCVLGIINSGVQLVRDAFF